jgi:hypothetical protein
VGGAACVVCAGGSACQQGSCVTDQPCFSYCKSGCCTSQGQCLDFTSQDAQSCGTGGSLCQACASSESCLGGQCQSDPVWEIWVVSAVLSGKKSDGKDWDSWPQKPLPDPYVYLTANPSYPCDFINADCGYTQKISNTVTPYWNKNVLARSHAFITSKPWHVEVLDSDGVLGVEAVGKCTIQITSGMLSFGAHTQSCGQLVSSLELKFVKQ